jgi:hypothetical protein
MAKSGVALALVMISAFGLKVGTCCGQIWDVEFERRLKEADNCISSKPRRNQGPSGKVQSWPGAKAWRRGEWGMLPMVGYTSTTRHQQLL